MTATDTDRQAEIEQLRARVAALEAELVTQAERAERAVAAAQERAYWLDRWHLDLNALMRKPGAAQFRGLVRSLRAVVRGLKKVKRTLTRGS
jgi:hypothetical protein